MKGSGAGGLCPLEISPWFTTFFKLEINNPWVYRKTQALTANSITWYYTILLRVIRTSQISSVIWTISGPNIRLKEGIRKMKSMYPFLKKTHCIWVKPSLFPIDNHSLYSYRCEARLYLVIATWYFLALKVNFNLNPPSECPLSRVCLTVPTWEEKT